MAPIPRSELAELRRVLRQVMRGLWMRRRPSAELGRLIHGEPRLGRRHVAVLSQVGSAEGQAVGDLARALGLSLPAASKLTTDLEHHRLVRRREDPQDRRRTVVDLDPQTGERVRAWLEQRDRPLERALAALSPEEQAAFLKGLRALAEALRDD